MCDRLLINLLNKMSYFNILKIWEDVVFKYEEQRRTKVCPLGNTRNAGNCLIHLSTQRFSELDSGGCFKPGSFCLSSTVIWSEVLFQLFTSSIGTQSCWSKTLFGAHFSLLFCAFSRHLTGIYRLSMLYFMVRRGFAIFWTRVRACIPTITGTCISYYTIKQ